MEIINNIDLFPIYDDKSMKENYDIICNKVKNVDNEKKKLIKGKFYVEKCTTIYSKGDIYYELTLSKASDFNNKFERLTFYSKQYIPDNYSVNITSVVDIDLTNIEDGEFKDYLLDTLNYGIVRYNREFGEYTGLFKLYRNYYKEQASRIMLKNGILQKGTYYEDDIAYIFAGIKKGEEGRLNYKDKFSNNKIFQWESIANVSESEKNT